MPKPPCATRTAAAAAIRHCHRNRLANASQQARWRNAQRSREPYQSPKPRRTFDSTNANGTTEEIPVKDDVYEITSGDASTVTLRDAAGKITTRHLATL